MSETQEIQAETPIETPAEGIPAQNTAEQAPAPEPKPGETEKPTDEEPGKRGQARLERRLARLTRERAEAAAERDLLRRQLEEIQQRQKPPEEPGAPKLADFEFDEEKYRAALEKHISEKASKEHAARRAAEESQKYQRQVTSEWQKKVTGIVGKYADFAEVTSDIVLAVPALYAMMEADNGPDIAYYLGTHDDEAERIAGLSVPAQIRAIGRLEAKLAAEPEKPKTPSKAPAPIAPVNGGGGAANELPSDKDDIETWMRKENARMAKAM